METFDSCEGVIGSANDKKDNMYNWTPSHRESFEKMKDSITIEIIQAYFDPKMEVTLQVAAFIKGTIKR